MLLYTISSKIQGLLINFLRIITRWTNDEGSSTYNVLPEVWLGSLHAIPNLEYRTLYLTWNTIVTCGVGFQCFDYKVASPLGRAHLSLPVYRCELDPHKRPRNIRIIANHYETDVRLIAHSHLRPECAPHPVHVAAAPMHALDPHFTRVST